MSSSAAQRRLAVPRFAEAAVERARLQVVPRVRRRAPRVPFVILVTAVLLGGIVGLLLFNTSMQQAAFTGAALEERATVLEARQQTLTQELQDLRDPQRLGEEATAMGMVPAGPPAVVDLGSGEIVVEGEVASRDDALDVAPPEPVKPAVLSPEPEIRDVPAPATPATPGTAVAPGAAADQQLPTTDDPAATTTP
ncbi:hypothetical protein INN71_05760 [Nocardioides sp. ChNu-153]|uniref:hypothetical protein n=1 Tax=unclassified Nocardioides TaxID=2615069 RepID=UPI0024076310|nr:MULTISPECIES: hypothetical protein [unclassified Nocardioides]MDF9716550.1 hypothetical protein [Nocardioides sp. ChNu-99]MDN7120891.1 hypothetical protein [Nocardioides sp. ChNu-153]